VSAGELKFDKEAFLARHWQREPLLIRHGIADFSPPLSADELAGLALEEGIESRIVEYRDRQWLLHHGPFSDADFRRDVPWTLLVQAVDHYSDEVAALRHLVDFLPRWRVDDVMVSYAVDGGSVGPHYDNYDVFLLQGEGVRRWQIGQFCDADTALLPHDELRLLSDFHCQQEYRLEPGDILYLPPGVAHWGIAEGECTTFSIGFRAPRVNDMVSRWADSLLAKMDPDLFYSDSHIEPASRAGEIRPRDLQRVTAQVQAALAQDGDNHWFGELVTEPRYDTCSDDEDLAGAASLLASGPELVALSPAARLAWQQEAAGIVVFANGEARVFSAAILPDLLLLCETWRLAGRPLRSALDRPDTRLLLEHLLTLGCIHVE
jgi:50S ribosomal protein L16 3-hydroxylase